MGHTLRQRNSEILDEAHFQDHGIQISKMRLTLIPCNFELLEGADFKTIEF
jgi:hypothetical protein